MKSAIASAAVEGFLGSFVLTGAIIAAVVSGTWRVVSRLYSDFAHHRPLGIGPGREVRLP